MGENMNKQNSAPTHTQTTDRPHDLLVTSQELDKLEGLTQYEDARPAASLGQGGFGGIDEHSGAYSFSVPIRLPASLAGGPVPHVSLDYNSMSGDGPSLIGAGWRLELGRIERQGRQGGNVNFKNNQGDTDALDHFVLTLNGKHFTLVNLHQYPDLFRAKIEKTFVEAERILSQNIDPVSGEPEIDHWHVYLPDGTRYRFGALNGSGETGRPGTLRNKMWLLSEINGIYGQKAIYDYEDYFNKDNPSWEELPFSYPGKIRCGVDKNGLEWDSEVVFHYTNTDAPSSRNGYYNLGRKFTGRNAHHPTKDGYTCIYWKRLTGIETRYKDEQSRFVTDCLWKITSEKIQRLFQVAGIEEIPYKKGEPDPGCITPPYTFTYQYMNQTNPTLMTRVKKPLGMVNEIIYRLSTDPLVDLGKPTGMEGKYLVTEITEVMGSERWTQTFRYWDGLNYKAYDEYRGHRKVETQDRETGFRVETEYLQNGIHNGAIHSQKHYDADGRLMTRIDNSWAAMDFNGGRYLSLLIRSETRKIGMDGHTVISTHVREIEPAQDPALPWKLSVDEYGNILAYQTIVAKGEISDMGPDRQNIVRLHRIRTRYINRVKQGGYRLLGMPSIIVQEARSNPSHDWIRVNEEHNLFNEQGRVTRSILFYDRHDPDKIYVKETEFHPETGKVAKVFRYDGKEKKLLEEIEFYETGPYRYLPRYSSNSRGQKEEILEYDLQHRSPAKLRQSNGMFAITELDGAGRSVKELFTPHETSDRYQRSHTSLRFVYTVNENERRVDTINIHTGTTITEYFDPLGRKFRSVGMGLEGRKTVTDTIFDHRTRNSARVSTPHFADEPPAGWTVFSYDDPRLRRTEELNPNGRKILYEYADLITRTFEDVLSSDESETKNRNPVRHIVKETEYDVLDKNIRILEGSEDSGTRYEQFFEYDIEGRLICVKDPEGRVLRCVDYGSRMDDKPVGVTDISLGACRNEYDNLGRLSKVRQDQNGTLDRITRFIYDDLDRIIEQQDTLGEMKRIVETVFDEAVHGIGQMAGRQITETGNDGTVVKLETYAYDDFGLAKSIRQHWQIDWKDIGISEEFEATTLYRHNGEKGGRLEMVEQPWINGMNGGMTEYRYDDLSGLLIEVLYNGSSVWKIGPNGFTPSCQVTHACLGNGLTIRYRFDPAGNILKELSTSRDNELLQQHVLSFDTSGNVRHRKIKGMMMDSGRLETITGEYDYDDKNQLLRSAENDDLRNYRYAPNGSRLAVKENLMETVYRYEGHNPHQPTSLSGGHERVLAYDQAGNLKQDENGKTGHIRTIDWNSANRMKDTVIQSSNGVRVHAMKCAYNGNLQRDTIYDSREDTLTYVVDDSFKVVWHRRENRYTALRHIDNGARRIASQYLDPKGKSGLYYYHRDHLHSVWMLTDEKGNISANYVYSPYGQVTRHAGKDSDILFTGMGKDLVNEFGFSQYDYITRLYDPDLGIFLSPDKGSDEKNSSFGLNRYVYVANNPLKAIDPDGKDLIVHKEMFNDIQMGLYTELLEDSRNIGSALREPIDQYTQKVLENTASNLGMKYKVVDAIDEIADNMQKGADHIIIAHGRDINQSWGYLGQCADQSGVNSITAMTCGAGKHSDSFRNFSNVTFNATENSIGFSHHGKNGTLAFAEIPPAVEANGKPFPTKDCNAIDLSRDARRTQKVFTGEPYNGNKVLGTLDAQPSTKMKVLKGAGNLLGGALKVVDVMNTYDDLKNGRVENLAKEAVSTAVCSTIGSSVPILGPLAFETGYAIGTAIHKATGGYIANKAADAMVAIGVPEAINAVSDAVQSISSTAGKIGKWFKSWW